MDISDAQQFIEKEIKAENYAVPFVYGVNFSDCLRMNGIATEIEVEEEKKIQAHRVYSAWDAFLVFSGETTGEKIITTTKTGKTKEKPVIKYPVVFTGIADSFIKKMYIWITKDYSKIYQSIATQEEVEWLENVIRFTVYRRIMEAKYHRYMTKGEGFADPAVAVKIAEIYRFKYEMPQVARLIHEKFLHHKDREAEGWEKKLAEDIIAGVFDLLRVDRLRLLPPVNPDEPKLLGEGEDAV